TGWAPFDLHVLSTPPAFVLSQDQTLHRDRCPGCPGCDHLKSRHAGFLIPRANWHEDGHWFVVRSSASCIDRCALRLLGVRPHSLLAFLYSVFKVHPRRRHASPKSRWCGPPLGEVRRPAPVERGGSPWW